MLDPFLASSKRQSSLLVQMRTEKIGFRDFLYQRGVLGITDPQCICGEGRQTVMHVLLRCRRFKDLRRQELSGIPGQGDLRAILNERKAAMKAINFIEQTQILRQFWTLKHRDSVTLKKHEAMHVKVGVVQNVASHHLHKLQGKERVLKK
jgi:hypothetical protein